MNNKLLQKSESIFKNKNFLILFIGRMVSDIGDVIYNLAIGWYILSITKSGLAMAIFMAVGTIVYMIMGPVGGVIADRVDRKRLIVWMDMLRGIMVAVVGLFMYVHITSIWLFYISASLLSICGAFFVPASSAIIPKIVREDQLAKANSTASITSSISNLSGVAAAGLLYALIGIDGVFLMNSLSFFICGFLMMFIHMGKSALPEKTILRGSIVKSILKEMKEGFLYLLNKKAIFIMLCFFAVSNFFLVPLLTVYIPYIFNVILKTSIKTYSIVQSCMTAGTICGALIMGILPQKEKSYGILRNTLFGVALILLCMSTIFYLYTVGIITKTLIIILIAAQMFIGTAIFAIINIPINVVVQRSIPDEFMGRVSSIISTLSMAAMPLGMIVGGRTADVIPMKYLIIIIGILYTLMVVIFTRIKVLKEL